MDYVEFTRVRKAITIFATVIALATIVAIFSIHAASVGTLDGHATLVIDSGKPQTLSAREALAHLSVPLGLILGIAGYCAVVMATVFASSLNKENDGAHFVFVKPIARERLAFAYFAIDAAGIVSAFAIGCIGGFGTLAALGLLGHLTTDANSYWIGALGIATAFMWYGILQAITAGYRGKGGSLVGGSWAVFGGLTALPAATFLGPGVVQIAKILNVFNPIAYFSGLVSSSRGVSVESLIGLPIEARVFVALGFAIVGCAVSIRQWKRVEA